jgi:hypothetical protein
MIIHNRILSRTLTTEFYRANAMFFLVVMGFCFGFMRGAEHMALAGYFVSSPWLVLIPIGVWIFYTLKVIAYNRSEVNAERNEFIYSLSLLRFQEKVLAYVTVVAGQLAPVIAYGLFLVLTANKAGHFTQLVILLTSIVILIFLTTFQLHLSLLHPSKEKKTFRFIRWLDKKFAKPMAWMLSEGIVRSQPGLIYTTKIVSCLMIYGATQLYLYDVYDERLYMMAACVVFAANLVLVYHYQRFEVERLLLTRSLPLTFTKRILTFLFTMMILCFPEMAMLATNLPAYIGAKFYFFAIIFGLSMSVFAYGALYVRDATFDDFTKWIFFVSMGLLLLILFSVPVWASAIVQAILGVYLLNRNYYSFELNT